MSTQAKFSMFEIGASVRLTAECIQDARKAGDDSELEGSGIILGGPWGPLSEPLWDVRWGDNGAVYTHAQSSLELAAVQS